MSRPNVGNIAEGKRKEALDAGISMTLDGEVYTVRKGDISPAIARRFRKGAGCSTNALFDEFGEDPDVDTFASFVWLAQLCAGEDLDLDDVRFDPAWLIEDDFDVDIVDRDGNKVEVGDSPEA